MAGDELRSRGWYLTDEGIEVCTDNGKTDVNVIVKKALDMDLREIGSGWLPDDINRGRLDYVEGKGVLQIMKIRNVSAPMDHEESQAAPRMFKLVLTDGKTSCNAIEIETLKDIGFTMPPGSKIRLTQTTDVEHGFLLLSNKNTKFLGGRVDKLAETWELKKKLAGQPRTNAGSEGGPPPFVPFGKRIPSEQRPQNSRKDNFKSLETSKEKKEDDEFEKQRQATIAEVAQAKGEGRPKTFGGGQKQVAQDYDTAKIMEMGFTLEDAVFSLKQNGGSVSNAINWLLNNRQDRGQQSKHGSFEKREMDRGQGRRGRDNEERGDSSGNRSRGRQTGNKDDIDDTSGAKPSGPATLFDFLEDKIQPKGGKEKENKPSFENQTSFKAANQSSQRDDLKDSTPFKPSDQSRTRTTSDYRQDIRNPNQQNRRQPDIPPRFTKAKNEVDWNQDKVERPKTVPVDYNNKQSHNQSERRDNYHVNNEDRWTDDKSERRDDPQERSSRNLQSRHGGAEPSKNQTYPKSQNNAQGQEHSKKFNYPQNYQQSQNSHYEYKNPGSYRGQRNQEDSNSDKAYENNRGRDNYKPGNYENRNNRTSNSYRNETLQENSTGSSNYRNQSSYKEDNPSSRDFKGTSAQGQYETEDRSITHSFLNGGNFNKYHIYNSRVTKPIVCSDVDERYPTQGSTLVGVNETWQ
ncbi:hypothetical protein ACJMK2_030911 [Sinanodonta woodiana]|uniref:UBA domain-containing protein n=1 Tax=Sinanodonta woodiana TaxID=1069815 RepID=A0ABD3WX82_SINWO